uniref:Olfactory receptor n=1 Tax=Leptobrachium leishanense TaxID=445787 RepID=A0A8C5MAL5_9ANUR
MMLILLKIPPMERGNGSLVTEFILLGLSSDTKIQIVLFHVFLILYVATIMGNALLIAAVRMDSRLHSSMYYFLANLSFMDICYSSVIVPRMLRDFLSALKRISLNECLVQHIFYLFLGETECILLAFMAFDRYVAICNPLRYNMVMSTRSCARMIAVAWLTGLAISSSDISFAVKLKYCGSNIIDDFFCEATALIQLTCSDVSEHNVAIIVSFIVVLLIPLLLILFSYLKIILSIVKMGYKSSKSFSTCLAHLIVVVLFYGSAIYTYTRPRESKPDSTNKFMSVFYTLLTPMVNPLIYSLKNKDVQNAKLRPRT